MPAGAAGLPLAVFRGYRGAQLPQVNPNIKSVTCPYTGEVLATVPAMRLDSAVIHAQRADRDQFQPVPHVPPAFLRNVNTTNVERGS